MAVRNGAEGLRPTSQRHSEINKKLVAALIAGSIVLGGVGYEISQSGRGGTPDQTPIAGGIGNPNPSQNNGENSTFEATPTQNTEINISPEEAAKNAAIETWLNTFSMQQKNPDNNVFLNFNIDNPEWKNNIQPLVDGQKIQDTLKISWLGGEKDGALDGNPIGQKIQGDLELKDVSLTLGQEFALSDADKANGHEWQGIINIKYLERGRNYYFLPNGTSVGEDPQKFKEWFAQKETVDPLTFSDWSEGNLTLSLSLINGNWQTDIAQKKLDTRVDPQSTYNGFIIPFDLFDGFPCMPGGNICNIVYQNPPY